MGLLWRAGRRECLLLGAASLAVALAGTGRLVVGGELLRRLDSGGSGSALVPALVVLGILVVLTSAAGVVHTEYRFLLSQLVQRHAVEQLVEVAAEIDLETLEGPGFHDRLERLRTDAAASADAAVWGALTVAESAVTSLALVAVVVSVLPWLALVAAVAYLPAALVQVRANRSMYALAVAFTESDRDRAYHTRLLTDRGAAAELRSYGLARYLLARHGRLWSARLDATRALVRHRTRTFVLTGCVSALALVITLAVVVTQAASGAISLADAAVAVVGLQQLSSRLQGVNGAMGATHRGLVELRAFDEFRALLPEQRDTRPVRVPPPPARLTVENLCYRYPGTDAWVLDGVNVALSRGQILAVVGANGSGKTTLAKILCGLLVPVEGRVCWDGVDVAEYAPDALRRHIAPVFQDFARYEFPLSEVVALGAIDAAHDHQRVSEAAAAAGLDDLVANLPEGMATRLGKTFTGGTDLSGGQWQRLAIARAFFRDAPMVVLDEPSAALDPHTEADLFERIRVLGQDRLVVFVSHRFASVRRADVVMVLDEGRVIELGGHDTLMAEGGVYADMYSLQAARFAEPPPA
ncbi:MAG: ABC transporter ATP-binding protein [Acidimicrobiales bacterium]